MGGAIYITRRRGVGPVGHPGCHRAGGPRHLHLHPDVESAYREAQEMGYEIVVPLRTEEWGVHRFFVRAPDGNVINIVGHPH